MRRPVQSQPSWWALLFFLWAVFSVPVSRAQNITLLANPPPPFVLDYGDVWGDENLACMGVWTRTTNYGVGIYDISNPANPILKSIYRPYTNSFSLRQRNRFEHGMIRNKLGYFASWGANQDGGGFHIVSLTNPAAPVTLSVISANTPGTVMNGFDDVHTMWLERNFIYEAAHDAGIVSVKVFDVSNPSLPVYVRDIVTTNTTKVHQLTVGMKGTNTILYTSGWGGANDGNLNSYGQTDIWDVSNVGTQPAKWLGRIYSGYNSHSSWPTPDGNTLVVCRETPGGEVSFYDISTPPKPASHSVTNPAPFLVITPQKMGMVGYIPHNPVIESNLLFVSWYQNGLQIFDIRDQTNPVFVGSYDTSSLNNGTDQYDGNWGIYTKLGLNKLLVSDIQNGLMILDASAILTGTNNYPPLLVRSPVSLSTTQGLSVTLSAKVTGSAMKYQWRLGSTNVPGATNSSLSYASVQPGHAGAYFVIASNHLRGVTSAVATLSVAVNNFYPVLAAQPESQSVYPLAGATFDAAVVGEGPFFYQWFFNSLPLTAQTNAQLTLPEVQPEHLGVYSLRVSNIFGTTTSTGASLTLIDSPYISGVRATPGSHSALISWTTTLPSDSMVQFDGGSGGGSLAGGGGNFPVSSYRDRTLTTNHTILLTGLELGTNYHYQIVSWTGTNYLLSAVYDFTTALQKTSETVLDNTNSSRVTVTGSWTTNTLSADKFENDYMFATATGGAANATATYRPNLGAADEYNVDIWYPQGGNRVTNAPFLISYNGGTVTALVNQQTNGGGWRRIGTNLPFSAGTAGFVRVSNQASGGSVVLADAVRFNSFKDQDYPTNGTTPLWWQNHYFGGTASPTADPDGDGYTTAQEYVLGTSPVEPNSRVGMATQFGGSALNVTFWPYHFNRAYELQYRPSLTVTNWQSLPLTYVTPTSDGHGVFTMILNGTNQGYYRLSAQMTTNSPVAGRAAGLLGNSAVPTGYSSDPVCGSPQRAFIR